jgi:hypothetical protein
LWLSDFPPAPPPSETHELHASYHRQWIFTYGGFETSSQHLILNGASKYDSESGTYEGFGWNIGKYNFGDGINALDMGQKGDKIQGGRVLTLCTVVDQDTQFKVYWNGTEPERYIMFPDLSNTATVRKDFEYRSSYIVVGLDNFWNQEFKGTIHETRLYNYSLTAQQVQDITDELCALYND